jgi:hypothetical protein
VRSQVFGGGMIGRERRRHHEADASLAQDIRGLRALARFEPGVRELREAERLAIEERRLLRIAHPELHVMDAAEPKGVRLHGRPQIFTIAQSWLAGKGHAGFGRPARPGMILRAAESAGVRPAHGPTQAVPDPVRHDDDRHRGDHRSGIFLTPSIVAQALPVPWLILAVWVVGGLMALSGGLTFAELAAMMPRPAGSVYLKEARQPRGFLFGWAYFVVCNAGGLGALSVAFATYVGYLCRSRPPPSRASRLPGCSGHHAQCPRGQDRSGLSDVFTILKLAGILALVAIGFSLGSPRTTDFAMGWRHAGFGLERLALAMVGVLWSFGGWQHATHARPRSGSKRTLPRAMITARPP